MPVLCGPGIAQLKGDVHTDPCRKLGYVMGSASLPSLCPISGIITSCVFPWKCQQQSSTDSRTVTEDAVTLHHNNCSLVFSPHSLQPTYTVLAYSWC